MRKEWLLAMCAAAMMASCAKDKTIALDNGADGTPEEIILGAGQYLSAEVEQGQPMKAASRGIGSVGDLAATNNWKGETVYVYGIVPALTEKDGQFAINGEAATAPAGTAGATVTSTLAWSNTDPNTDTHFYYDGNNLYDFYGCHVDDAATAAMTIPTGTDLTTAGFSVPVTIDGTQDLMVAMPNKESDRTAGGVDQEQVTNTDYLYSAWSSRRGVKPNLVFKHVLTRLTFKAKCGNAVAYDEGKEVYITSVKVVDAKNKGTLTIIPTAGNQQVFTASDVAEDKADFSLMQGPTNPVASKELAPFEEVKITGNKDNDFVQIGVPMMLVPGGEYFIVITTKQDADGDGKFEEDEQVLNPAPVKISITDGFKAGYNYNVKLTVYGLEEIAVDATLTAWENGQDIEIDPDDINPPTPSPVP